MLSINEQEILVDDLQEVETKLFNLSEQLGSDDERQSAAHCLQTLTKGERERSENEICKLNHC